MWINAAKKRDRTFLIDNADEIKIANEAVKRRAEKMGANIAGTITTGDDEEEIQLTCYTGFEYILHPRGFYEIRSDEQLIAGYERNIQDIIISHHGGSFDN